MTNIITYITRGKNIESTHKIKALVINSNKEILLTTNNNENKIFPRSAIKAFQAIPFAKSGAISKFNLSSSQIALACSSHCGEEFHINELSNWIESLNISVNKLKCGIHNPLNLNASNKLLLSGSAPDQLYNNCSGKHLAMLTSCIYKKENINNYLNFEHPHQLQIKKTLEAFTETKISKIDFGLDGCSAPQYAFKIIDLAKALLNLVNNYNLNLEYSSEVRILLNSILHYPRMIGGSNKFDSFLIRKSNKKIFCKGGAEGVFLFAHLTKKIVGVIKVVDGNERALPSAVSTILKKLKITSSKENKELSIWSNSSIFNHAKKITGKVFTELH